MTLEIRNSLVVLRPTALGANELVDVVIVVQDSINDLRGGLGSLFITRWRSQTNTCWKSTAKRF